MWIYFFRGNWEISRHNQDNSHVVRIRRVPSDYFSTSNCRHLVYFWCSALIVSSWEKTQILSFKFSDLFTNQCCFCDFFYQDPHTPGFETCTSANNQWKSAFLNKYFYCKFNLIPLWFFFGFVEYMQFIMVFSF